MAAAVYNARIEMGTTWVKEFTWKDGDKNPKDISGATAVFTLRYALGDSSPAVTASSAGGEVTNGGASGKFTLTLSDTVTAALTPGKGVWDFLVTESDGTKTKLIGGSVTIARGVTR